MADTLDLLEEFPIRVTYPGEGRHFLLAWSDYHEGTHVILARSEAALVQSFKAVVHKLRSLPNVDAVYDVDLVSPPEHLRKAFAELHFEIARDNLRREILMTVKIVRAAHPEARLPLVKPCPGWEFDPDANDGEGPDTLNFYRSSHLYCAHCNAEGSIVALPDDDTLFRLYRKRWLGAYPNHRSKLSPGGRLPRARPARDPYYVVHGHGKGLGIERGPAVGVEPDPDLLYHMRETRILFEGKPVDVPAEIAAFSSRWEAELEQSRAKAREDRERGDAEAAARLFSNVRGFLEAVEQGR